MPGTHFSKMSDHLTGQNDPYFLYSPWGPHLKKTDSGIICLCCLFEAWDPHCGAHSGGWLFALCTHKLNKLNRVTYGLSSRGWGPDLG